MSHKIIRCASSLLEQTVQAGRLQGEGEGKKEEEEEEGGGGGGR